MRTHGERLREALARADRSRTGKGYPTALQQRAGVYGRRRLDAGASTAAVAQELGVSRSSLHRWMGIRDEQAIMPVVVEAVQSEPQRSNGQPSCDHGELVVTHEDLHLRIEGLSVEDVVVLIERLW